MGMTKCPDCGKEISDMAQSCPNCGRPMQINAQGGMPNQSSPVFNAQQTMNYTAPKKKGAGCLVAFIILAAALVGFCVALSKGIEVMKENPSKYDDSIAAKYMDVNSEESLAIDTVLNNCGISKVISFEHDELLDNAHSDGETGYRLAVNDNVDNIILYINSDKTVHSLSFNFYPLYENGTVMATLQDYTLTSREMSDLQIRCQSKVEEVLKSPSTAKFPNILEWGFSKEKNIVIVQGYVDSQNSFGAEIRSDFQFTIDTDTNTIQSLIFDGQEMVQQ